MEDKKDKLVDDKIDDILEMPRVDTGFTDLNDVGDKTEVINFTDINNSINNGMNKSSSNYENYTDVNNADILPNQDRGGIVFENYDNSLVNNNSNYNQNDFEFANESSNVTNLNNMDSSFNEEVNMNSENQNINQNINNKNRYFGYNERLIFHIAAVILLFAISLILVVCSISLNSKSSLTYNQTSNLDYRVGLKPNNYYSEPYLGKGMKYIANLIDYIDVDFNYNFKMSDKINYRYVYYVKSDLLVNDRDEEDKIIYSKSEKLTEQKLVEQENSDEFTVQEAVKIDYEQYNDLVKSFKSSYAIDADSKLILTLYVDVIDEKGNRIKSSNDEDAMRINIPLTEQVIDISLDYKEVNNSYKASVYKEFNISNKFTFALSIILFIAMLFAILKLVIFIKKTSRKKTPYDVALSKILREYDRVIVSSKKPIVDDNNMVEVNSFAELLDARDNVERPITFYEVHKGQKSIFVVRGDKESYKYVLKLVDLENKKNY